MFLKWRYKYKATMTYVVGQMMSYQVENEYFESFLDILNEVST